ncbi:MAG TPA: hypothetical protein VGH40_22715 [Roseiarcus sp.]|jgi:hypothetical protein
MSQLTNEKLEELERIAKAAQQLSSSGGDSADYPPLIESMREAINEHTLLELIAAARERNALLGRSAVGLAGRPLRRAAMWKLAWRFRRARFLRARRLNAVDGSPPAVEIAGRQ